MDGISALSFLASHLFNYTETDNYDWFWHESVNSKYIQRIDALSLIPWCKPITTQKFFIPVLSSYSLFCQNVILPVRGSRLYSILSLFLLFLIYVSAEIAVKMKIKLPYKIFLYSSTFLYWIKYLPKVARQNQNIPDKFKYIRRSKRLKAHKI